MKFMFYPKGVKTVVIKDDSAFTLEDALTKNWNNPVSIDECKPLKEGKKLCKKVMLEIPYGEYLLFSKYLKAYYKGAIRSCGAFRIEDINIYYVYLRNEVGEQFLSCNAKLPEKVLAAIIELMLQEYEEVSDALSCQTNG
jgi:hypothetical protein